MPFVNIVLIALLIEAIVNAIKPLWDPEKKIEPAEIVSMVLGIVLAVACKINLLDGLVELQTAPWVQYIFYALTGIAIGRGPSFLHDIWKRIQEETEGK